jgi:hypothetical protein
MKKIIFALTICLSQFASAAPRFEFEVIDGYLYCHLQQNGRPVGESVPFNWCAAYGRRNNFKFAVDANGDIGCYLHRGGRPVGDAQQWGWCR